MYYAKNGDEITVEQWSKLFEDMEYRRVGIETLPNGRWVSTVWLGIDHGWHPAGSDNPILIFETMVFDGSSMMDEYVERYSTEEQALEGHTRTVAMVRELQEIATPVEEVQDAGE